MSKLREQIKKEVRRGGNMSELLLDGSLMPSKEFYKKFKEIVGCSYEKWIKRSTTISEGGEEWYQYKDKKFRYGGTAYSPPKLYKILT